MLLLGFNLIPCQDPWYTLSPILPPAPAQGPLLQQCPQHVTLSCPQAFALGLPSSYRSSSTIQSMEFSRPGYQSGYPFPSPGDLPNPGIKPRSPALWADSLSTELSGKPSSTIYTCLIPADQRCSAKRRPLQRLPRPSRDTTPLPLQPPGRHSHLAMQLPGVTLPLDGL